MPRKGAFKRCIESVQSRGGVSDPRAVCAASIAAKRGRTAGRVNAKKRGRRSSGGMTSKEKALMGAGKRLALAGVYPAAVLLNKGKRKKKNPSEDAAAEAFREFHGHDAEEVITFETMHHFPRTTSAIGDLVRLIIRVPKERGWHSGKYVDMSDFGQAWLTEHPTMKQLYVEGGDQSLDLAEFGLDDNEPHEVEFLGELVRCEYFTDKSHLGKDGGEAVYHHKFGKNELTLKKTELIRVGYHVPDEQILFVGGGYEIPAEGIDG
jgi:hypothetical protein